MIIDTDRADPLPLAARYDVCIAGGGIAGIVIAASLAGRGKKVLLLEAGGLEFAEASQKVYAGPIIGHEYYPLDETRLRFLGGTSNHWGGWCRVLDPFDFEHHPHIEESGWPIGIEDIGKYLPPALEVLEIAPFPPDRILEGSDGLLKEVDFRFNSLNFQDKYIDLLKESREIDLFLNANVIDIVLDTDKGRVSSLGFRGYGENGDLHSATADNYVLAMGGIENARALLNANRQISDGLGNRFDLVGRYFMEHLVFTVGAYTADSSKTRFGDKLRFVGPTRDLVRRSKVANCGLRIRPAKGGVAHDTTEFAKGLLCESDIIADLVRSTDWFDCPTRFDRAGLLRSASEQVPNRNSRVRLTDDLDRFGLRRAALDWRLSLQDKITIRLCLLTLGEYFANRDIGRVKIIRWLLKDDLEFQSIEVDELAGRHHMGTTRMGSSPRDGVVDRDCRVFDVPNLYIAGSSVFRTCGHANPTFTIVQLALRLADHLVS